MANIYGEMRGGQREKKVKGEREKEEGEGRRYFELQIYNFGLRIGNRRAVRSQEKGDRSKEKGGRRTEWKDFGLRIAD